MAHREAFVNRHLGHRGAGAAVGAVGYTVPPKCTYRNLKTGARGETPQVVGGWIGAMQHNDRAIFYSTTTLNAVGKPAMLGRLSAIELPAGDYEFAQCAYPPNFSGAFSLPFAVADGEARYLGRIEVEPVTHELKFGIVVKDAQAEDFEMIRALWPRIELTSVRKTLLTFNR